jgi:light-regulated signal transduction histidine kinase (bacteriophytochrome)
MGNRYVQHSVSIVTALFLWAVIACDRYEARNLSMSLRHRVGGVY